MSMPEFGGEHVSEKSTLLQDLQAMETLSFRTAVQDRWLFFRVSSVVGVAVRCPVNNR